jgi:hypothetical protein
MYIKIKTRLNLSSFLEEYKVQKIPKKIATVKKIK